MLEKAKRPTRSCTPIEQVSVGFGELSPSRLRLLKCLYVIFHNAIGETDDGLAAIRGVMNDLLGQIRIEAVYMDSRSRHRLILSLLWYVARPCARNAEHTIVSMPRAPPHFGQRPSRLCRRARFFALLFACARHTRQYLNAASSTGFLQRVQGVPSSRPDNSTSDVQLSAAGGCARKRHACRFAVGLASLHPLLSMTP